MDKSGNNLKAWATAIIAAIIVFLIGFIITILFSNKESHISNNEPVLSIPALYCKGENIEESFFKKYSANKNEHEIKIIFDDGKINKINYTYTSYYESESASLDASSQLHADYNIYLSRNGVDQESLLPTFSVINQKSIINLSMEQGKTLSTITARIVFLDNKQYSKIDDYSVDDIENIYKQKGFNCQLINQ